MPARRREAQKPCEQVLGEIALLDGKPRIMSATALEPTNVFLRRQKAALGFLEEKPSVAIHLIGVLCHPPAHGSLRHPISG
jgi:CRP-like cAMP-binding protein